VQALFCPFLCCHLAVALLSLSLSLYLSRCFFRLPLLTFGFSGGIKQEKPRKILLVRAPADTEEPMVMVKEKGSMALHSTGWGPGERERKPGQRVGDLCACWV